MIREIENFERLDRFNHYHRCQNPFIILTTKVDVTNIVNYCKEHKNFYATFGFVIMKTVNQVDAFRYRYKDGKFYFCEKVKSTYTENLEDNNVGFFAVPAIEDFKDYIDEFKKNQRKLLEEKFFKSENTLDEIWLSCAPWLNFTSLVPPINKEISIPQFIWDRYRLEDDRYYVSLMVMVHHGFADGYHVGQYINLLEENIENFKGVN